MGCFFFFPFSQPARWKQPFLPLSSREGGLLLASFWVGLLNTLGKYCNVDRPVKDKVLFFPQPEVQTFGRAVLTTPERLVWNLNVWGKSGENPPFFFPAPTKGNVQFGSELGLPIAQFSQHVHACGVKERGPKLHEWVAGLGKRVCPFSRLPSTPLKERRQLCFSPKPVSSFEKEKGRPRNVEYYLLVKDSYIYKKACLGMWVSVQPTPWACAKSLNLDNMITGMLRRSLSVEMDHKLLFFCALYLCPGVRWSPSDKEWGSQISLNNNLTTTGIHVTATKKVKKRGKFT